MSASYVFKSKSGISLIAVLMFMLAATTASVVVFRWISSENFASGARLKQSEAYQASEAGLDAAYSWLTFQAMDVGGVLGHYALDDNGVKKKATSRPPIDLTSLLATRGDAFGDKNWQHFKVYLVGADVEERPFKLKVISEGTGRDNSVVSQMAVFSVDGLYNMKMPKKPPVPPDQSDYDEDFWGNMGTANELEVARAIITQSPAIKNAGGQALNKVTIGTENKPGYLVLDGNFYVNNGLKVYGDVYATGDLDFCPSENDLIKGNLYVGGQTRPKGWLSISEDAYFKGGINPNASINTGGGGTGGCGGGANGGVLSVGGNCTVQDSFFYWNNGGGGGLGFHVAKNMVMDNGVIVLTRQGGNNTDSLSAYGNVYIKNPLTGNVPNTDTKPIPFFGNSPTSAVCIQGGGPAYRTNSTNINPSTCNPTPPKEWGADPLDGSKSTKDLREKLGDENKNSCENTPIQFNKDVYEGVKSNNPPSWVHREDKPGSCDISNGKMKLALVNEWVDLGKELQNCWDKAKGKPAELYEGEWLVVYIKDKIYFSNPPSPLTTGKYMIVFEHPTPGANNFLYLPPTSTEAQVMLYFPIGFSSRVELGGTQIGTGYRYFIFSDGDIGQFDVTSSRKLHGNVFMNNCAVMNAPGFQGNAYFKSEGNSELVKELTQMGILCKTQEGKVGCQDGDQRDNPSSSSTTRPAEFNSDRYYTSISPRLKVKLESKNISREKPKNPIDIPERDIKGSIMVMPRVIYLGKKYPVGTNFRDYYNFIYVNSSIDPDINNLTKENTTANCVLLDKTTGELEPPTGISLKQEGENAEGIYLCTFADNRISPFIVDVSDKITDGRQVKFSQNSYEVSDATDNCATIQLIVSGTGKDCQVLIEPEGNWTNNWSMEVIGSTPIMINKTTAVYKICSKTQDPPILLLNLTVTGGSCEAIDPKRAEVIKNTPKDIDVKRKDVTTDPPNWPNCNAYWTIRPPGACEGSDPNWRCEEGATIELGYMESAGCTRYSSGLMVYGNINKNSMPYTFEASYKRDPVILSVINSTTDNGFVVGLTANYDGGVYGGTCPTLNSNGQCQLTLYHSLPYALSITGPQARYTYNNQIITLPYTLTPTANGVLAILPPNTVGCAYDPAWCNGIPIDSVKAEAVPRIQATVSGCYFVSSIERAENVYNSPKINGVIISQNNGNLTLPEKADEGYYVYLPAYAMFNVPTLPGNISPDCKTYSSPQPPQPSSGAFKTCAEAGFKASDVPGYNGTCASIGIQDDYNSDLYDCICRGSKEIYQNQSGGKLACYEYYEVPSGMVKCTGDKVAKQ